MTVERKLEKVLAQVKTLSPEEQTRLRILWDGLLEKTPEGSSEDELERRLFAAGLLAERPRPIADLAPYQNRQPVEAKGRPLSEVIVEERR